MELDLEMTISNFGWEHHSSI